MSKIISSHNLAQLERLENGFKKNVLLAQIAMEKIDSYDDNTYVMFLLDESIRDLDALVNDLFGLDMCLRDEVDFEPA